MHALLRAAFPGRFCSMAYLIIKLRSEEQEHSHLSCRQSRPPAVEMDHCRRLVLAATSDYPPSDRLADVPDVCSVLEMEGRGAFCALRQPR